MEAGEAVGLLLTPEGRQDPYPTYGELRRLGPVAYVDERFAVATGYAVIGEILRDPRMLVHDREYVHTIVPQWEPGRAASMMLTSMLQRNAPDHTRMRRLAAGAFTPRRIGLMREAIAVQVESLLGYLAQLFEGEDPVDFMAEFAYPLPIRMICTLLGVPTADQAWFREHASELTVVLEPSFDLPDQAAADRAADQLRGYFVELVARRRADPLDDLTTALVHADGEQLDGDELLANLILLLVAGFETTTNLLGNGLALLLARPDLAAALRADPALAPSFVEEVLRYDSPVQLTSRWCRDAVVVDGVRLEPYSQVLVLLGAGNRDPGRYPAPHEFDPRRDPNQPLSFGAGVHYCLGAALARMEAQIAFPMLLHRLPQLALAAAPTRRPRLTLRGYAELPVTTCG
jgi:cytochrome P450